MAVLAEHKTGAICLNTYIRIHPWSQLSHAPLFSCSSHQRHQSGLKTGGSRVQFENWGSCVLNVQQHRISSLEFLFWKVFSYHILIHYDEDDDGSLQGHWLLRDLAMR